MHGISFFAAFLASAAMASEVSSNDVARASAAFVSEDSIGSLVLKGCSVANVSQRGHLWIVALSPSGHIVMSGSDLADPIVAFSKNDFIEPDPESPAFSVLEGVDSSMAALEAQGGGTRHERWTKLLGGGAAKKGLLRADALPSSATEVVEPFLFEHFNQWQPYNDYAPVHEPDESNITSNRSYRGRCPCGCVATAAAQLFHYFKWPARIDGTISHKHVFTDDNNVDNDFQVRFDGYEPICWNAISNNYAYSYSKGNKTYYDLRGEVAETVRHPIARLILWCDVMANMQFSAKGSSSLYDTVAGNVSDWYTSGHWVEVGANADYSQVFSDLQAGVPLQVGLVGHQVVAHGLAVYGSSKYIYLNYGWGGGNDGYYNMNMANSSIGHKMQEIFVGHYPRAKPQIDPLPAVSGTDLTLNWHFPDFHTNKLSEFKVSVSRMATMTSTFLDDFSASEGSSSSSDIYVDDDKELYSDYAAEGSYTYPKAFTLTSASELTFKVSSYAAISATLEVQARYNGGSWQTISIPDLDEGFGSANWNVQRVYLGDHGGETAQFRIVRGWGGVYYIDDYDNREDYGYVLIDDFKVTNVLAPLSPEIKNVGKTARSCAFTGLAAGSTCSFSVTPIMLSGALAPEETSAPVTTSIAGERQTPKPGVEAYHVGNMTFSASDTSGSWSYSGSQATGTYVYGDDVCFVVANLQGPLTENSILTFGWKCYGGYMSGDVACEILYVSESGETTLLERHLNWSSMSDVSWCNVPLNAFQGNKGAVKIRLYVVDPSAGYWYDGLLIRDPAILNVNIPYVSDVVWDTETLVARGTPEILSVSDVSEGFYGECWTNTTTFSVVCSETVETLEARPSHLSLVRDEDVSVSEMGNGKFKVCVTPSGINETNFRSRMILTLVGTDSNGTKCYKDLSLRFSQVEPKPTEVHVEATTSSGDQLSVEIPYSWIEENGLVTSGSDAAAHEAALASTADADSDGLPNWAEYVCGTSPTNSTDKLTVSITMEDGKPVVTYSPDDSRIISGFKAVIKGTSDLAAALSAWDVVTDTRTSTCRFFRVEIVPEN